MVHFLVHGTTDNVAVAVVEITKGETCLCLNLTSREGSAIEAAEDIPLGHKVALRDLDVDGSVIKYDRDIGRVTASIQRGEHVHVHNLKTRRW